MDDKQAREHRDRLVDEQRRKEDARKKLTYALQDIDINRARYMQYGETPLDWEAQKAEAIKVYKAEVGEVEMPPPQSSAPAENQQEITHE